MRRAGSLGMYGDKCTDMYIISSNFRLICQFRQTVLSNIDIWNNFVDNKYTQNLQHISYLDGPPYLNCSPVHRGALLFVSADFFDFRIPSALFFLHYTSWNALVIYTRIQKIVQPVVLTQLG